MQLFYLVDTGGPKDSMLCASGFEFEEKLRLAKAEQERAQRALQAASSLDSNRLESASKRYNRRLSDFVNHKRSCTLCRDPLVHTDGSTVSDQR
jgi:hypothetical protein